MPNRKKQSFPESIKIFLKSLIASLDQDGWFTSEDIPVGYDKNARTIFYNIAGNVLMKAWLDGEEIYFDTEEQFDDCLRSTIVETCMVKLIEHNFIDGIENEHGNMVVWLTDKGMVAGEQLIQQEEEVKEKQKVYAGEE